MRAAGFTHDNKNNTTVDWYTPKWVFDALGLIFDLDPCQPPGGVQWIPAKKYYTEADDGLAQPWSGLVWLNPPYGKHTSAWLAKMHQHRRGVALVFARTDCAWFHDVVIAADAILLLRGRIKFVDGLGATGGGGAGSGSMLVAWGEEAVEALERMASFGAVIKCPAPNKNTLTPVEGFATVLSKGTETNCKGGYKMSSPSVGTTDIFDDLFDPNAPLTEQEKEELQIRDPKEKKPCPECGKLLTWTADGARPRAHKCVKKADELAETKQIVAEALQRQAALADTGGIKVDDVVAKYVELRTKITEMTAAFDAAAADVKSKMLLLEKWLVGKQDFIATIAMYIATRDQIAEAKAKFELETDDLKALQERRESWMLGRLDANGATSMGKPGVGTCFVDWKDSATVADGDAFLNWVHGNWAVNKQFLENRVSKTAVKQRLDEGETPPPGVNYTKIKGVKVRRS